MPVHVCMLLLVFFLTSPQGLAVSGSWHLYSCSMWPVPGGPPWLAPLCLAPSSPHQPLGITGWLLGSRPGVYGKGRENKDAPKWLPASGSPLIPLVRAGFRGDKERNRVLCQPLVGTGMGEGVLHVCEGVRCWGAPAESPPEGLGDGQTRCKGAAGVTPCKCEGQGVF